jgi:acylphosphatase
LIDHIAQVEGEAQGDESALDKLKKDLNEGPKHAKVVKLETKDIPLKEGESGFSS